LPLKDHKILPMSLLPDLKLNVKSLTRYFWIKNPFFSKETIPTGIDFMAFICVAALARSSMPLDLVGVSVLPVNS
jgi:hypothetical protein